MALLSSQTVYVKRGANVVQETLYKTGKRIFVDGYLRYAPDDMIPEDEALKYGVITQEELDARKSGGHEEATDQQEQLKSDGNNAADYTFESAHFTSEELGEQPSQVDVDQDEVEESAKSPTETEKSPEESTESTEESTTEPTTDRPPAPSVGATRETWDKHAQTVYGIDTSEMTNKQQVIDAVYEAEQKDQ